MNGTRKSTAPPSSGPTAALQAQLRAWADFMAAWPRVVRELAAAIAETAPAEETLAHHLATSADTLCGDVIAPFVADLRRYALQTEDPATWLDDGRLVDPGAVWREIDPGAPPAPPAPAR